MTREISEAEIAFLLARKRLRDFPHTIDFGKEYSLKLRNGRSPIARALAEPGARIDAILYLDNEEIDCSVRIVTIEHLDPKKVSRGFDSKASFGRSELQASMAANSRDEDLSFSTGDESSDSNEVSVVVQIDLPADLQLLDAKVVDGKLEAVGPANPSCTHVIFCDVPEKLLKNTASADFLRVRKKTRTAEELSTLVEEAANSQMPENSGRLERFNGYSHREFGKILKSGDTEAWEFWYAQYHGLSCSWTSRLKLKPNYDQYDVLQESSVKLFNLLDKANVSEGNVSEDNVYTPFISRRLIRNEALNFKRILKAEKRGGGARPISLNAEIAGSDGKSLAETIQARSNDMSIGIDDLKILDLALTRLDPKDRDIILDRLQENSFRDIGTKLGISEATARQRHSRALERLREQYICCDDEIRK